MNITIIDYSDNFCFIFGNNKFTIIQFISIRCKSAVPFALTSLLFPSCHCLCADILSLDFCHRRQHRDHQLSCILGAVNAILHADQIDTEILHELQRVQNVRCISAKSGQLKDQHIRNIIFAVLDVIQHPLKLLPPLDVLSRKALVRILPGNDHILVCRILPQLVTLGIQAVSVNLHRGGHSCIKIAFKLFLFQNLHLPHSFLLP